MPERGDMGVIDDAGVGVAERRADGAPEGNVGETAELFVAENARKFVDGGIHGQTRPDSNRPHSQFLGVVFSETDKIDGNVADDVCFAEDAADVRGGVDHCFVGNACLRIDDAERDKRER